MADTVSSDVHILGICGTFMGGIAALAIEKGLTVSGQDAGLYPPMSDLLDELGVAIHDGYDKAGLNLSARQIIVGNALSRGNPALEAVLNHQVSYTSGPQWLGEHILPGRDVYAVAGTHGKTSTSSMLAWIFEQAGKAPGYLIGGKPGNFSRSARLGQESGTAHTRPVFVVEADEYDTAFFDKRSKFLHYRPKVAILNNLEFDHADIFPDLAAIQTQFHHMVRCVPANGCLIVNGDDPALAAVLNMGCWTPVQRFSVTNPDNEWFAEPDDVSGLRFRVLHRQQVVGNVSWSCAGQHNLSNALAAIAAAHSAGVAASEACQSLAHFKLPARRLQAHSHPHGFLLYEDFAHHPTAIAYTLKTLKSLHPDRRLVAVLEPRSNTMKMGVHHHTLADALALADRCLFFSTEPTSRYFGRTPSQLEAVSDLNTLYSVLTDQLGDNDVVVVMSNGDFGGLIRRLRAE